MTKMKWLGWINLYFLLCGIALVAVLFDKGDLIANNKIPVVDKIIQPAPLPTLEQKRGEVRSGYDIAELLVMSDEKLNRGKELYAANCASCHGQDGYGDGVALNPAPRNFHSLEGWTYGPEISNIFKTLTEGIAGTGMSSYGTLPVEDRMALSHFVRTFAEGYPEISNTDETMLRDVYELDQDKKDQSVVPIEVAIDVLAAEAQVEKETKAKYTELLVKKGFKSADLLATAMVRSEAWKVNSSELAKLLFEVGQNTSSQDQIELSSTEMNDLLAQLTNVE